MSLTETKRSLRKKSTPQEQKLWLILQNRNLYNYKFRRQVLIDSFIVDFCCFEKRIILEIDGGFHKKTKEKDYNRDQYLRQNGFKVLRFWNGEIDTNFKSVINQIKLALKSPSSVPLKRDIFSREGRRK